MAQYRPLNDGQQNFTQATNPQIVAGFQILRQSVDLGIQQSESARKSSMKAQALVSRQSQMINQMKEQKIMVKDVVVPVDAPTQTKQDVLKKAQNKGEEYRNMDEHKIDVLVLANRLGTSKDEGLSDEQAVQKNLQFGDNKLTEKKKTPWWMKLLKEMFQPFSILLWIASIACFVLYGVNPDALGAKSNLWLAIILILIILLTGSITYNQSAKADALMEGFKNFLPQNCIVIRGGQRKQVPAEKIVPGDIVEVKMGDKIPADIRVIQSREMKVDNSALTGECDPLLRVTECTAENPLETKNLAFFGTLCKEGSGLGMVIQIGDKTVMGQIADLATGGETPDTPLNIELKRFVILISCIAVGLGILFLILSLVVEKASVDTAVGQAIGIIVANVPEGLLGCITVSLAITAKRLADKQVLVKNLEAVETLGSTSCICSDKTGTLTQNKMTVENVWYDGLKRRALNKLVAGKNAEYEYETSDPTFRDLHDCAIITSEAKFNIQVKEKTNINWLDTPTIGDASETALIKFFQPIEDIELTRQRRLFAELPDKSLAKMPFNSTNKFSLCIVNWETHDSYYCVYIKGAPEKLWTFCSYLLVEGRNQPIDEQITQKFKQVNLTFGKGGERVLGFAKLHLPRAEYHKGFQFNLNSVDTLKFRLEGFTFLGLLSLMDPPKVTVPNAIKKCQSAGIKVIMVTGDQPPTAGAIAKQIGIITGKTVDDLLDENPSMSYEDAFRIAPAIVIHGDLIVQALEEEAAQGENLPEEMKDRKLRSWCSKPQVVFARTSPAQKLMIVRACQYLGHVVGVTGDGVNDSPAIKQGDIGISMGISGSDVTKDAADMILLNDDFASIVDGVEEGRKIFDNLKKTIVYLLTSNITEVFPYIGEIAIGLPLPLSNSFILTICIGTDILPAISFAYEEAEIDIMTRKPRKKDDHLVSLRLITHAYLLQGVIATSAGFFSYFSTMNEYGFPPSLLLNFMNKPYQSIPWNKVILANGQPYAPAPTSWVWDMPNLNNPFLTTQPYSPNWQMAPLLTPPQNTDGTYDLENTYGFQTIPLNWINPELIYYDLRYIFVTYESQRWTPAFDQWNNQYSDYLCRYFDRSDSLLEGSGYPINTNACFKTAALKYAQTSYFVAVVLVQWSNVFSCKQRKMSMIYSPINRVMFYGVLTETIIFLCIVYIPGVNTWFGARPVDILNLGMPGLPYSMCLFCWEETRKYFIRNFQKPNKYEVNFFEANSLW
ncbi:unnamed protein product [Paramecium sonneborni]|uniref:Cation-transporting P-type ATPase N-terminal domain-containing protein n=1 Tax=Paramecium sonneborni TaxID=65129 RepID=A0A8S1M7U0_9CILI|nr:unnamed protein product [Paramecium sonneborni]